VDTNERPRAGLHRVRFGMAGLMRDPRRPSGWLLGVNDIAQSYVDVEDPTHLEFPYLRQMAVALHCVTGPRVPVTAVHIGGGGCTMPRYLAATRPGSTQVVVEADGELMDLVRVEFGIDEVPGLEVRIGDGREYLESRTAPADVVMLDAYDGGSCVGGMVTVEAARLVAGLLRPGGVAMLNVIDSPGLSFARRVVATMTSVYDEVLVLVRPEQLTDDSSINLIVVAGSTLPTEAITELAAITAPNAACLHGAPLVDFQGTATPLTDDEPVDGPRSLHRAAS
jgi:spermidine synthase